MGWYDEDDETRKAIKTSVKREVYKRAKGICENPKCPKKLLFKGGATCYHHIRKPSISPTAKTVQLLCQNCHAEYGHKHKTITSSDYYYEETERVTIRKRVGGKPKPAKKKTTKKKLPRKKTGQKKKPVKRKTAKKVTRKKTVRRKTAKKTTKKKTTKTTTKKPSKTVKKVTKKKPAKKKTVRKSIKKKANKTKKKTVKRKTNKRKKK